MASGIYVGSIESSINTKELLSLGITHVLNVSCMEYTKREHYFKYYNLAVYDNHDEDIKKFFRITNRFIDEVGECDNLTGPAKRKGFDPQ